MRRVDLVGKKFGKLTVIAFSYLHNGMSYWKVRCDCGKEKIISVGNFGRTKSCGCAAHEGWRNNPEFAKKTHGMSRSRTYQAWRSMLKRIAGYQPRYRKDYTDRGIMVDPHWESFENFLSDMGECPDGMTLERKNNDLSYYADNCTWATMLQQNRNRRTTVLDETKVKFIRASSDSGADVARQLGISSWTVYSVRQNRTWKNVVSQ